MRVRNFLYSALWVVFACFAAPSCTSHEQSPMHFRVVLDRPANPNHIPLYVGQALGYFGEEGMFIEIQKPSTDSPLAMLDAKSADLVLASLPRVFRSISRKSNLAIAGRIIEKPLKGFLVLKTSGMKVIQDFNGRIMGYDGAYSILPSAEVILDANNVQVGCRINLYDQAINDLVSKKIDIVYGALENIEPEYLQFLGHNPIFFRVCDYGMPQYEEVVIACRMGFKANKKLLAAFQRALQRSIDFCKEKPQLAFEMYINLLQSKSRKTIIWEELSWNKTVPLLAESQNFSLAQAKALASWQYQNELIGRPIDVAQHLTYD